MIKIAALYIAVVVGAGLRQAKRSINFRAIWRWWPLWLNHSNLCMRARRASLIAYCPKINFLPTKGFLKRLGGSLFPYLDLVYSVFLIAGLSIMIAGSESLISTISLPQLGRIFTIVTVLLVLRGS